MDLLQRIMLHGDDETKNIFFIYSPDNIIVINKTIVYRAPSHYSYKNTTPRL